jgi:hypothetical protein
MEPLASRIGAEVAIPTRRPPNENPGARPPGAGVAFYRTSNGGREIDSSAAATNLGRSPSKMDMFETDISQSEMPTW